MTATQINGILNINKPTGMTSREVVDRVQRIVRPQKVGHAGTLDPLAEGVLIVCVGAATRLVSYVQQMRKQYRAMFRFGCLSETDDVDGNVKQLENAPVPSGQQILAGSECFVGTIQQQPPTFSALKIQGRRAYQLAREGKPVELAPRAVSIHSIEIVSYNYPYLALDISCGSGTYIRSLGRDLAKSLQTAAVMTALTRVAIGEFRVVDGLMLDSLDATQLKSHLLPMICAVPELEKVKLSHEEIVRIHHGLQIENRFGSQSHHFAGCDAGGRLLAILTPCEPDRIRPLRNFITTEIVS